MVRVTPRPLAHGNCFGQWDGTRQGTSSVPVQLDLPSVLDAFGHGKNIPWVTAGHGKSGDT